MEPTEQSKNTEPQKPEAAPANSASQESPYQPYVPPAKPQDSPAPAASTPAPVASAAAPQPIAVQPQAPSHAPWTQSQSAGQPQTGAAGKSRKGLFIGLGAGLIALLILVFFIAFILPSLQAHAAATAYMTAASKGDANKLVQLTGDSSQDNQNFEKNVADSLTGSFKLTDNTTQDGKYYMLYELTGAKDKYARVIVE